jgi:predicted MFS family arabinose efflux permease
MSATQSPLPHPHTTTPSAWIAAALAGFCATLIGLGIGRFSYVALLPLLIDGGWTSTAGASQLAAANLIGYLLGALGAHRLAVRFGASAAIRGGMLVILLSLLACSVELTPVFGAFAGLAWLWFWRLVAGVGGGLLMILAAPYIMARVPARLRGKAVGVVFSGIGCGIVLSGFLVPAMGAHHLSLTWLGLGALVVLAMLYAWPRFAAQPVSAAPAAAEKNGLLPRGALLALLCAYMLDGVGYLPHTVFWVEFLVHGLGKPLATGGMFWAIFGVGAMVGPLLTGLAADRFGFRRTVIAVFALKALGVALPLISTDMWALVTSSLLVGALTPGLVAVTSGRVAEIVGTAGHQRNWALLTFTYAVLQAAGGYGMATLYAATHSFTLLFAVGAGALGSAAVIASLGHRKHRSGQGSAPANV